MLRSGQKSRILDHVILLRVRLHPVVTLLNRQRCDSLNRLHQWGSLRYDTPSRDSRILRYHVIIILLGIRRVVVALHMIVHRTGLVDRTLVRDVQLRVHAADRFDSADCVCGRHHFLRILLARCNRRYDVARNLRGVDPLHSSNFLAVLGFNFKFILHNFHIVRLRYARRCIVRILCDVVQLVLEQF